MSSLHADPLGPHSDVVSTARLLLESKGRRTSGKFLVEGTQNVLSAIQNGLTDYVLAVEDSEIVEIAQRSHLHVYRINEASNKALTDTKTPQGIYAVCKSTDLVLSGLHVNNYAIVLDRLSDPGNVGTIIRTAAGFGADAVISLVGTADVWSGKVVRSTAGAFAQVDIYTGVTEEELENWMNKTNINSYALSGYATDNLQSLDLTHPHIWMVGNEANGLTDSLMSIASKTIRIPMVAEVDSLNAAMAVGICAFTSFNSANN